MLVSEVVDAVDEVVQQLGHEVANRLRQGLVWAYLTVCVSCPVALTRISGVAVASILWKGEGVRMTKSRDRLRVVLAKLVKLPREALSPVGSVKFVVPVVSCCWVSAALND